MPLESNKLEIPSLSLSLHPTFNLALPRLTWSFDVDEQVGPVTSAWNVIRGTRGPTRGAK